MKLQKSLALLGVAALFLVASASLNTSAAADEAKPADAKATDAKTADTKAAVHEYVGSKACKACHMGATKGTIYEIWEKTAHASATAKLPDANKKDGKCLACHSTGFGKPGGFDPASAATATLEGVGCESCHGPAKDYKAVHAKDKAKAAEAGMVMKPDAGTCKGCHEGTFPTGHPEVTKFDFATMYKQIEHKVPKK